MPKVKKTLPQRKSTTGIYRPEGTIVNSPTIYRWGQVEQNEVRQGTKEYFNRKYIVRRIRCRVFSKISEIPS